MRVADLAQVRASGSTFELRADGRPSRPVTPRPNLADLTGLRFGRLVVVGRAPVNAANGGACWSVRCDCGAEKDVVSGNLVSGSTNSCGCLRRELLRNRKRRAA